MTQKQIETILGALRAGPLAPSGRAGMADAYHVVAEFRCQTGNSEEVTVKILDGGPDFEPTESRYVCRAETNDGKLLITGDGGSSPGEALESVHWGRLQGELARVLVGL